uniref:Uncharacterized protein n=1 Tax=Chromera velia CCMP2878 TaxID=1169474 RepID=A0A0G4GT58_9ALVE|eukprot:Cvel_5165.t1-p1 / transcript=Cvel_5165.t1 / gene=Cvel_5165 / organism=Chromera_velia_CCMP2878 / gene_product=hypothetical protein / transcript_product=hypothetical protein / location=Cvel_scaffold237:26686-30380(+) / protein_length=617 / sequence_SO=supercontig / SO=protein_coding / is_pseudo=false
MQDTSRQMHEVAATLKKRSVPAKEKEDERQTEAASDPPTASHPSPALSPRGAAKTKARTAATKQTEKNKISAKIAKAKRARSSSFRFPLLVALAGLIALIGTGALYGRSLWGGGRAGEGEVAVGKRSVAETEGVTFTGENAVDHLIEKLKETATIVSAEGFPGETALEGAVGSSLASKSPVSFFVVGNVKEGVEETARQLKEGDGLNWASSLTTHTFVYGKGNEKEDLTFGDVVETLSEKVNKNSKGTVNIVVLTVRTEGGDIDKASHLNNLHVLSSVLKSHSSRKGSPLSAVVFIEDAPVFIRGLRERVGNAEEVEVLLDQAAKDWTQGLEMAERAGRGPTALLMGGQGASKDTWRKLNAVALAQKLQMVMDRELSESLESVRHEVFEKARLTHAEVKALRTIFDKLRPSATAAAKSSILGSHFSLQSAARDVFGKDFRESVPKSARVRLVLDGIDTVISEKLYEVTEAWDIRMISTATKAFFEEEGGILPPACTLPSPPSFLAPHFLSMKAAETLKKLVREAIEEDDEKSFGSAEAKKGSGVTSVLAGLRKGVLKELESEFDTLLKARAEKRSLDLIACADAENAWIPSISALQRLEESFEKTLNDVKKEAAGER